MTQASDGREIPLPRGRAARPARQGPLQAAAGAEVSTRICSQFLYKNMTQTVDNLRQEATADRKNNVAASSNDGSYDFELDVVEINPVNFDNHFFTCRAEDAQDFLPYLGVKTQKKCASEGPFAAL